MHPDLSKSSKKFIIVLKYVISLVRGTGGAFPSPCCCDGEGVEINILQHPIKSPNTFIALS